MRMVRMAVAVVLVAAAMGAAACGGDDGEADAGAPAETTRSIPSTGVPPATPADAAACLADEGLDGTPAAATGEDAAGGAEQRLQVSGPGGEAVIVWYATEEQAFDVHSEFLSSQEPNTTVGRKTTAVYVASGEDFSAVGRAVTGCL